MGGRDGDDLSTQVVKCIGPAPFRCDSLDKLFFVPLFVDVGVLPYTNRDWFRKYCEYDAGERVQRFANLKSRLAGLHAV
jgi:hypothetical protein